MNTRRIETALESVDLLEQKEILPLGMVNNSNIDSLSTETIEQLIDLAVSEQLKDLLKTTVMEELEEAV